MTEASLRTLGVALIGTGFMGAVHTEALRRVGVRLVGILGSTPQKSEAAARRWGYEKAYATLDELLADTNVQAVHVNTPNRLHLPQTLAALAAGKHVLCEKPLGMDSAESGQLVTVANAHPHLATGVNYNNRFYALCQEARERVVSGSMGRLFHITGSVTQDWLLYDTDYNWRVLREEQGELRALADIGSHWLDLIHFITGLEIEAVCADFTTVHPVRQRPLGEVETFASAGVGATEPVAISTDDYGAVLIRFAGGARGCFFVSQVSPGRKYRVAFEVAGQNATLAWNSEDCESLWTGRRGEASSLERREPGRVAIGASDYPAGHAEGYPDSFKMCFRRFYEYIAAGDFTAPKPYPTFADGHRDNLLCDALRESQQSGKWVTL
jgi:predicted dehydrogenase